MVWNCSPVLECVFCILNFLCRNVDCKLSGAETGLRVIILQNATHVRIREGGEEILAIKIQVASFRLEKGICSSCNKLHEGPTEGSSVCFNDLYSAFPGPWNLGAFCDLLCRASQS